MDALATPSNWQKVRLGTYKYRRGSFPQPYGNPQWYSDNGMPFVQVYDVGENFKLTQKTKQKISKIAQPMSVFVPKNSVIITLQGTIGRVALTQYDCYCDRTILIFDNNTLNDVNKYFFVLSLFTKFEEEKRKADGSIIKTITKQTLKDFEILLPSLNEQIAIANILSDVDRYLYSLDALILKKESIKKALSFELLSQRKRLKGFNQAWQRVRLGDIAEIKRGVRITKNELDVFGKYPVVSGGVGFLGYTNNFNRYENTITIAQYGTAGFVNWQNQKFWANDVCFCVYPNKDVIKNIFLYYFLKVNQNYLYEISNRNATPYSISKDKILDFEILLPPLDEQIAIANILKAVWIMKSLALKTKNANLKTSKKL